MVSQGKNQARGGSQKKSPGCARKGAVAEKKIASVTWRSHEQKKAGEQEVWGGGEKVATNRTGEKPQRKPRKGATGESKTTGREMGQQ